MDVTEDFMPPKAKQRKWISVGITVVIAGLLTLWGIYGIGEYGIALFILTPFFIGAFPVILYGRKYDVNKKEALYIGLLSLSIFGFGLFLCAIEGAICIAMAAPFAIILSMVGSMIGLVIISKTPRNSTFAILLFLFTIPLTAFVEKGSDSDTFTAVTSITINASPKEVWKNVIGFPPLKEPDELLFKTGISYPTDAVIEGTGVGSVRHCNFSTGSFTEPVTVWDEPNLLCFNVTEQPAPMKELSFWDVDAPHLHDFFISEKGQFKLTELPGGKTLLEGTTWYHHDIRPQFYWKIWSDLIIHKIHERVLTHIKTISEKTNKNKSL
ncbi:MAG TPA: hypothetical protein VNZ49_03665 [Bacteroidia bacterium]|jgi:hypothetical protein|nr:hypothetical protein [Bacteroidia bacterium]